ncbi:hypothetical protein KY290_027573 [Solanum tuberosum]|uniref:Uncharacterized protein n=1 Tax=Solanum tuberosum TaxID=4113 RepID=A0ABQ7UHA4_SOLTU|nr:hypothetical protein KY285_026508 [Solanum tuberosum]KAH0748341.1 hypothetical protein KY290_027573 [Solanum tuberosum]
MGDDDLKSKNNNLDLNSVNDLPPQTLQLPQQPLSSKYAASQGLFDSSGVPTPMCSITVFSALKSDSSVDISKYQQLIGMLQYLSLTRPDIAFTINKLAQFMHCPNQYHWKEVKRLFKYFNRIFSYGIQVPKEQDSRLVAYSGSDWEGEPIDRTSTTGYVVYLGSKHISWSFKKQRSFSRSSTEDSVQIQRTVETYTDCSWGIILDIPYHFNCPEKTYDGGVIESEGSLTIFCEPRKSLKGSTPDKLDSNDMEDAHFYILKNCDEIQPFLDETSQQSSDMEWNKNSLVGLYKHDDRKNMEDLLSLSRGPLPCVTRFNGHIVNGYRFHVKEYDQYSKTQNCGVVVVGETSEEQKHMNYYGELTEVNMNPSKTLKYEIGQTSKIPKHELIHPGALAKGLGPFEFYKSKKVFEVPRVSQRSPVGYDNADKMTEVYRDVQRSDTSLLKSKKVQSDMIRQKK